MEEQEEVIIQKACQYTQEQEESKVSINNSHFYFPCYHSVSKQSANID